MPGRDNDGPADRAPTTRSRVHRAHRDPGGDGALVPRVLHVGHRLAGPARRARRAEAGAPPHPLLDVRPGPAPRPARTKCAKVVGEVMGKYHPHGDSAIYDALARMVQDFSLRHPLIDGHGNFGGTGPDEGPAAMRYTECRLAPLALEMMAGIDEETVDFVPNYDGTDRGARRAPRAVPQPARQRLPGHRRGHGHQHPAPQPGRGHRRHRPRARAPRGHPRRPHGVREGPRLPHRGADPRPQGILDAYRTGKGSIKMRALAEVDEGRAGETRIVVTDIPYQTSIDSVSKKIDDLADRGDLDGIAEVQNDSAGRQAPPGHPLEARRQRQCGAQQPLQAHAAADQLRRQHGGPGRRGAPHAQPGPDRSTHYVAHQVEVVTRRSEFRLARPRRGPTSSRACSRPSTCSTPSSPPSAAPTTGRRPAAPAWPSPSFSARSRPTTSST